MTRNTYVADLVVTQLIKNQRLKWIRFCEGCDKKGPELRLALESLAISNIQVLATF